MITHATKRITPQQIVNIVAKALAIVRAESMPATAINAFRMCGIGAKWPIDPNTLNDVLRKILLANTAGRLSDTIQIGPDEDDWNEDINDELVPLPSQQNGVDENESSDEEEDDE